MASLPWKHRSRVGLSWVTQPIIHSPTLKANPKTSQEVCQLSGFWPADGFNANSFAPFSRQVINSRKAALKRTHADMPPPEN
jgi:hypothetical protein